MLFSNRGVVGLVGIEETLFAEAEIIRLRKNQLERGLSCLLSTKFLSKFNSKFHTNTQLNNRNRPYKKLRSLSKIGIIKNLPRFFQQHLSLL